MLHFSFLPFSISHFSSSSLASCTFALAFRMLPQMGLESLEALKAQEVLLQHLPGTIMAEAPLTQLSEFQKKQCGTLQIQNLIIIFPKARTAFSLFDYDIEEK